MYTRFPSVALLLAILWTSFGAGWSCSKNEPTASVHPPATEPTPTVPSPGTEGDATPHQTVEVTGEGSAPKGGVDLGPAASAQSTPQAQPDTSEDQRVERLRGVLRLFLPFHGSRDSLDFTKAVGYRIVVPIGFNESSGHDAVGIVTLNREDNSASAVPLKQLKTSVKKDHLRGGAWLSIDGVSREDKYLTVTAYGIPVQPDSELAPGDQVFSLPFEVEAGGDFDIQVDLERNEVKKMSRPPAQPKSSAQTGDPASAAVSVARPRRYRSVSPHTSSLTLSRAFQGFRIVTDLFVGEDYLFATTGTGETLEIFDLWTTERDPHLASFSRGRHPDPNKKTDSRNPRQWFSEYSKVRTQGRVAYVLNGGYGVKEDLMVLDIEDAASPKFLGSYNSGGEPQDLHLSDGKVYLLTNHEFQIVDVRAPRTPRLARSFRLFEGKGADLFDMEVVGDHVYVGGYRRRPEVFVLDISNADSIKEISSWATPSVPFAIRASGRTLFVSEADTSVKSVSTVGVYQGRNPARMERVASIPLEPYQVARDLLVVNDRLYLSIVPVPFDRPAKGHFDFLKVYDIREPKEPRLIDAYGVQDGCPAQPIAKHRRALFIGTLECGIMVLDEGRP